MLVDGQKTIQGPIMTIINHISNRFKKQRLLNMQNNERDVENLVTWI